MPRTVVIGGGVIGCAIAQRLAREGHQVTLLERDRVGAHASGAAAGLLAPYSEGWASDRLAESAVQSLGMFPELAERIRIEGGVDVEYRETRSLRLALDDAQVARVRALAEKLRARGVEAALVEGRRLRDLEPELAAGVRAAILAEEAQVTPIRFVEGMARSAIRHGAEVRQSTPAVSIEAGAGGEVHRVRLPDASLQADWVVVAAGPWSAEVVASLGLDLDVKPRRGQLVALAPERGVISHMLTVDGCYLVPKPDGTIVAGSTEEEMGFDARPTVTGVRELLEMAERAVPALSDAAVGRVWAGIRPYTDSGLPEVAPSDRYPNLVIATGHHRDGILLAPITAEVVAHGMNGDWKPLG